MPITDLIEPLPWSDLPAIRHGGGGDRVDLVCGYLVSDDPLFDPALRVFPSAFVVRLPKDATRGWVQASVTYAATENVPSNASPSVVSTRLPELVLIEVLRHHLASAPAADHGWLAALHDPVLAPALALLHGDPARRWTVADLAGEVAVSTVGARRAVPAGSRPITDPLPHRVAHAPRRGAARHHRPRRRARSRAGSGYESEEAFSRAFKRAHGDSPGRWRARERAPAGTAVTVHP